MMNASPLVLLLAFHVIYVTSLSSTRIKPRSCTSLTAFKRREFLASATLPWIAAPTRDARAFPDEIDSRATTTLQVTSPNTKLGLELKEFVIGTPPRTVVAVQHVRPNSLAARAGIQEGSVVVDYTSAQELIKRIQNGPFPLTLKFYNLAAGGDAIGDFGKPLVTAQDALNLAKSSSNSDETNSKKQQEYVIRVLKEPPATCNLKSRRGDVLEIVYEAHFGSMQGPVYDSSAQRGTGQPYQFVLGSGDMIPGVDNCLIQACPGEVRQLEIPPALGYGPRASKSYGIPSQSSLYWTIQVISVNSVRVGDARDREELEGRAAW